MIVVGSRGTGGFAWLLMGSVSTQVSHMRTAQSSSFLRNTAANSRGPDRQPGLGGPFGVQAPRPDRMQWGPGGRPAGAAPARPISHSSSDGDAACHLSSPVTRMNRTGQEAWCTQ